MRASNNYHSKMMMIKQIHYSLYARCDLEFSFYIYSLTCVVGAGARAIIVHSLGMRNM